MGWRLRKEEEEKERKRRRRKEKGKGEGEIWVEAQKGSQLEPAKEALQTSCVSWLRDVIAQGT